jgi:trimeric autotransporter adhesin
VFSKAADLFNSSAAGRGTGGSDPGNMIVFNNNLVFTARRDIPSLTDRSELKKIIRLDTSGVFTTIQDGIVGDTNARNFVIAGSRLFGVANISALSASTASGLHEENVELISLDTNWTFSSYDLNPGVPNSSRPLGLYADGSDVYMSADTATNGREVHKYTAASNTVSMVTDVIKPGTGDSNPGDFQKVGSNIIFTAEGTNNKRDVYKILSGGSTTVTKISDLNATGSSNPVEIKAVTPNLAYITATNGGNNYEAFTTTDGNFLTSLGEINTGSSNADGSNPNGFFYVPSTAKTVFAASTNMVGQELFSSLGTPATTSLIRDLNTDTIQAFRSELSEAALSGWNFLTIYTADKGTELWKTNGQTTQIVKEIFPGSIGSNPSQVSISGTLGYFTATDADSVRKLFRTDGTAAGTYEVAVTGLKEIDNIREVEGVPHFTGYNSNAELVLYKLVGTTPTLVKNFGQTGVINEVKWINGAVYMSASDNSIDTVTNLEPWKITSTGAFKLADVDPNGSTGSRPRNFVVTENGNLYFAATVDKETELYVILVGTTTPIKIDLYPGSESSNMGVSRG